MLITADLLSYNSKNYVFLVVGDQIITYELTANSKLKNKRAYNSSFFNATRVSFRSLYRADSNKLLILDDFVGLREVTFGTELNQFDSRTKVVYEQQGCFQLAGQNKGDTLVLSCAPSAQSYLMLKLIKNTQFTEAQY